MKVIILLIILILLTIISINYVLNSGVETLIHPQSFVFPEYVPRIEKSRGWSLFDNDTFQEINDFFDYHDNWQIEESSRTKLFEGRIVEGYSLFKFVVGYKSGNIIPQGSLIIIPQNDIHWSDNTFLKCETTGKKMFFEPNSYIKWDHDIRVYGNNLDKLRLIIGKR